MGITFRQDLAAVPHPSNASTRKYGQSLVMQQQQQKYAAQQAGYDRMFQLNRDYQQNAFMAARDQRQQAFLQDRDKAQQAFQVGRDKTLFEQQQQMQQAEQRRKFMEEARRLNSGMIMDDIKNGMYDPITAWRLQQSLVEEAEVLGSDQYDAPQRAEALKKLRALRLLDSTNRLEKPPEPTPQEKFEQSIITDPQTGMRYFPNARGGLEPLPESKQQQQMRPKSFQDYYSENEDKFQKDLDATMQAMQVPDKDGKVPEVTQEKALAKMQKDYEFRQKALGRPTFGTPTDAPKLPNGAQLPTTPAETEDNIDPGFYRDAPATPDPGFYRDAPSPLGQSRSILEQQPIRPDSKLAEQARALGMDLNAPNRGLPPAPVAQPLTAQLPDPGQPPAPAQQSTAMPLTANSSSQNAWSEVAAADTQQRQSMPLTANSSSRNPAGEVPMPTSQATAPAMVDGSQGTVTQSAEPNFKDLEASAQDDMDKSIIRKMKTIYGQNESPEVRGAISALLGDDPIQAAQAADYLQSVGIDLEKLTAEAQYSGTGRGQVKTSPRSNSSARYGSGRGGVRTK